MADLNPKSWRLKTGTKISQISTKASYVTVGVEMIISSVVECAARDRKVVGSIPAGVGEEVSSPGSTFFADTF